MKLVKELREKLVKMKREAVLQAARCFDIHREQGYGGYTIGLKEFEIQRVSVVQKN